MDFARKQLEKYGWSDGKGLGKHENGISQALKPKLKRSVAGIGHDAAADFTEHWWSTLYDKAAGNVEVTEKNGKTKKIKTKDDKDFIITNSTWRLNKKPSENKEEYSGYFVKTVVLTEGGTKKLRDESEGEEEVKDVFKMTDEELFAACEGRTAHKGARFGLRATGKLSRIQAQEQKLLTEERFCGYSHAKKIKKNKACVSELQVVEDMNLNSDNDGVIRKKSKKKRCQNKEKHTDVDVEATEPINLKDKSEDCEINDHSVSKIEKKREADQIENVNDSACVSKIGRKKKRKTNKNATENVKSKQTKNADNIGTLENDASQYSETSKLFKKKRKSRSKEQNQLDETNQNEAEMEIVAKKKKKKK